MSDPRLILGPDGARLQFIGGAPLMDAGLENLALISLFTSRGWCGNKFMKNTVGSDFEEACNQPITRQQLERIRKAAELALQDPAFGNVAVSVTNPSSYQIRVDIRIQPPGSNPQELILMRDGGNWISQGHDPAYRKVRDDKWQMSLMFEDGQTVRTDDTTPMRF